MKFSGKILQHNLMLRKIMSDHGAILSEILRKNLPRTHNLVLRKIMSNLGAISSEILRQSSKNTQSYAKKRAAG